MNKNKYFALTLIAYNKDLLNKYLIKTKKSLESYITMDNVSIVSLPIKIKKFGVNRSPHVTNKSKEMFEIRQYSKMILIKDFDDYLNFVEYADETIPSGCNLKIKTNI